MGYTHYYRRKTTLPKKAFAAWADDVRQILAAVAAAPTPVVIRGWDGTGEPEVTPEKVSFNGDEATDNDYETFLVERVYEPASDYEQPDKGFWFAFCKTARRPYDTAVTAALIRFKHHFGEKARVSSDGDPADWAEGLALCGTLFGEAKLPFEKEAPCPAP